MALKSKFAKHTETFRAQKVFTDRVNPRKVFRDSILKLNDATLEENREIITYYGKGGIGKTKLLKELYYNTATEVYESVPELKIHNIFLSLDAYDYSNPVNILLALRSEISGDCSLFDYALVQYYTKTKLTIEEIKSKNSLLSSAVMDLLNEFINIGMASVSIPTNTVTKCISWIQDMRFKAKHKEDIEEISTLTEFEIFERLPYYLGLCLSNEFQKGHAYTFFLDSYESAVSRTVGLTPSVDNEEWLKELFLASDVIRIVIASRDRINWEKDEADWKEYLNQHRLQNLSDEDSRWFLEQVPIHTVTGELDQELISDIVQHAGGVPLYLDMCVDLYTDAMNKGETLDIDSLHAGETIIDRYLRHLCSKDKYAVRVLSLPRSFDPKFAARLLSKQNLAYHESELLELLDKSVFLNIDNTSKLWKVDESVRLHIFAKMSQERKQEIIGNMLDYILENRNGSSFMHLATIIDYIEADVTLMEGIHEKLIEAVDYFSNSGYWNEIHSLIYEHIDCEDSRLHAVSVYAELIRLRRAATLTEAADFAAKYPLNKESMGIWHYLYRYQKIQIRHLQGYYDESLANYQALMEEMQLIRSLLPSHVYNMAAMKYADLLFLKGKFNESLAIVEDLLERPDTILVDKVELIRIKGHIYRFNRKFKEGAIIYQSALDLIKNHGLHAYEGKLYNNMTEVYSTMDPEVALQWYEKSVEENTRTDNDIELGKTQAAGSAAYTTLGDYEKGITLAKQAILTAEKTGYKSGRAFALAALYYAESSAQQTESASATLEMLKQQIQEIGVYEYLLNNLQ